MSCWRAYTFAGVGRARCLQEGAAEGGPGAASEALGESRGCAVKGTRTEPAWDREDIGTALRLAPPAFDSNKKLFFGPLGDAFVLEEKSELTG